MLRASCLLLVQPLWYNLLAALVPCFFASRLANNVLLMPSIFQMASRLRVPD